MRTAICFPLSARCRRVKASAIALAGVLSVGFFHAPILREIASLLILQNPLEPAAAIVVLNGGMPSREIEAAKIYNAGWAPVVVIIRGSYHAHSQDLQDLGLPVEEAWKVSREILIRYGVPMSAILVLRDEPAGTLGELQAVAHALGPKNRPVILVTSPFHTTRVRLTWEYATGGGSRAIVRAGTGDSFDHLRRNEQPNVLTVVREYLGVINAYARFPISSWNDINRTLETVMNFFNQTKRVS